MGDLLEQSLWAWFVIGGLLLLAEVFLPGVFLLWLGLAAIATGGVALVMALSWQAQVVIFAILALVAVLAARQIAPKPDKASDRPFLNRRADGYVGRVFTLEHAIHEGIGRVRIDDTIWRVEGPDLPVGARVKVVAADGPVLRVEPA
ncbi:NfeD family protein [Xanthobacter sp. DSM 24535]|uniref:NfeD family protein n=1 Tax=Roseixanthobacter psychrophilus TaxID=3119917 RepID=UPI00372A4FFD